MTWIIHGNPSPILEMWRTLSIISINLTSPPHAPFPLIQQIFFCFSKSGWHHLLKFTHTTFLLIAWKWIFRRRVVSWSHSLELYFNRLSQFFFSLSYLIISDFKPWGDFLQALTYLMPFTISQTCVCLMVNLVLLNLTLFLTVHFHLCMAMLPHTCPFLMFMLLFHSATTMWLHHVFNLHYVCPRLYQ